MLSPLLVEQRLLSLRIEGVGPVTDFANRLQVPQMVRGGPDPSELKNGLAQPAELVVQKHLGSDSLARWLEGEGWPTSRLLSRGGYRILVVEARPGVAQ